MSSISLLKGQKEVLQIEFSRFFGLRYVVQFIRNVRRLLLRSTLLRVTVLLVFAVCVVSYTLFAGQDRGTGTGEPLTGSRKSVLESGLLKSGVSLCNNTNTP